MSYIGRTPQIGAYSKLDAITTDGSASYTMQLDSANFVPESVNHLIVSVNGVIQAPTDSFTVSGSTITFASSLSVSDTIDFIMALGNVLDIGVPSDATISASKLATTSITGQTAETSANDSDSILIYDDSATALRKMTRANFLTGVGGTNTPAFLVGRNTNYNIDPDSLTTVPYNLEFFDTDNAFDTSTYTFTVPSGKGGKYFLQMNARSGNITDTKKIVGYILINNTPLNRASFQTASSNGSEQYSVTVSGVYELSAGDTIKGAVFHQSGAFVAFEPFGAWISGFKLL